MSTTPRTTSTPYGHHTRGTLQDDIAIAWWGASSFSSLSSAQQGQINRILDDGVDRIDAEGFGHYPWFVRQIAAGITLVSGTADYNMPADARRVISMKEVIGGKTRNLTFIPLQDYEALWGDKLRTTHPLHGSTSDQDTATIYWTFVGMDDSAPPVWIVRRMPTPGASEAGGKLYPLYRPYAALLADSGADQYPELVPAGRRALLHYAKMVLAGDKGDQAQFAIQERLFNRELIVLQKHEGSESEEGQVMQLPGDFVREIQSP